MKKYFQDLPGPVKALIITALVTLFGYFGIDAVLSEQDVPVSVEEVQQEMEE